jgi:membrane protease YdiL (CAAX protease family)
MSRTTTPSATAAADATAADAAGRTTRRAVLTTAWVTGALVVAMGAAGTIGYLAGLTGYAPLVLALAPFAAALVVVLTRRGAWARAGFVRPDLGRPGARTAVALAALLPVTVAATARSVDTAPVHLAGFLALAGLVAFVEETLFRGLLPARFPQTRPVLALVVPTIAFTLAHAVTAASPDQATGTTVRTIVFALAFGLLATLLTRRTASIWPAVALHAAFDTLGFLVTPRDAVTTDVLLIVLAAGAVAVLVAQGRRTRA